MTIIPVPTHKDIRKQNNLLTQIEVAEHLGINRNTLAGMMYRPGFPQPTYQLEGKRSRFYHKDDLMRIRDFLGR